MKNRQLSLKLLMIKRQVDNGNPFADEIFRVFKHAHPGIAISPINMNEAVQFMIERVGK